MSPELSQYLFNISVAGAGVAVFIAILVIGKKITDATRSHRKGDCIKTEIPGDGEQKVCLEDEYAASSVRAYMQDQDDCPECYCSAHHMNCPDNFRRLRGLASSLLLESTLHENSRFELGKAAAYGNASAQLTELLDELEGKTK